jgi:ABC-type polysaccharide/polyol phosphate export permease
MGNLAEAAAADLGRRAGSAGEAARPSAPRPEIRFHRHVDYRRALVEIWGARELIRTLAERDLRARYKQTVLGLAWAVVTPLLLMGVFTLVFTKLSKVDSHGAPYVLFAYTGLVPWTFFSSSLTGGGSSLVANMSIVNKIYCPREVFPIAAIATALVDTLISTAVLGIIFAATGTVPKVQTAYVPLALLVLSAFALGMTLIVASLLVYLRDLRQALPILLQLGLFATPVAYGIELIAKSHTKLLVYSALNPLAPVIDTIRRTTLFGQAPDWGSLGAGAATSVLVLAGGYWLFKKLETGIADVA